MLKRTETPFPPSPKVGEIVYATDTDDPQTGDIRELLVFTLKREWEQFFETWNGLWWIRYASYRGARTASKRFVEHGGDNG